MYIMIHDSGDMVLLKEITKDDLRAADDGYVELIDVSRADEPFRYFDEGWTDIDVPNALERWVGRERNNGVNIMSMEYIRDTYSVPAKRGVRVMFTGNPHKCPQFGTITGARGQYLNVRMDGEPETGSYHPIWRMEYLVPNDKLRGSEAVPLE